MSRCTDCGYWLTGTKKIFRSAEFSFPMPLCGEGEGRCTGPGFMNGKSVPGSFGCLDFSAGDRHTVIEEYIDKEAWEVWEMISCPNCSGNPSVDGIEKRSGACMRCAGTGLVRKYGDGWEGEEQTRLHPEETRRRRESIEGEQLAKARAEIDRLTKLLLQEEKPQNWSGSPFVIEGNETKLPFE